MTTRRHPDAPESVVYFFLDRIANRVKIGFAKDVYGRFCRLKARMCNLHFQVDLECVRVVPGALRLEQELHERFGHLRFRGEKEWFHWCDEIEVYVNTTSDAFPITDDEWLACGYECPDTEWAYDQMVIAHQASSYLVGWRCRCEQCADIRAGFGIPQPRVMKTWGAW